MNRLKQIERFGPISPVLDGEILHNHYELYCETVTNFAKEAIDMHDVMILNLDSHIEAIMSDNRNVATAKKHLESMKGACYVTLVKDITSSDFTKLLNLVSGNETNIIYLLCTTLMHYSKKSEEHTIEYMKRLRGKDLEQPTAAITPIVTSLNLNFPPVLRDGYEGYGNYFSFNNKRNKIIYRVGSIDVTFGSMPTCDLMDDGDYPKQGDRIFFTV